MIGELTVVTRATAQPVDLQAVKSHLRIKHDDDNSTIARLVRAATRWAEGLTGRKFVSETYDWRLPRFPAGRCIEMPRAPLSSVTSVKYQDVDDSQQTFAAASYNVSTPTDKPGVLELDADKSWPSIYDRRDAVEIRFVAGYGTPAKCPDDVKAAICLHVEAFYDRGPEMAANVKAAEMVLNDSRLPVAV